MASSTTKPVATVSAISDRLSRLKPSRYIIPNVPSSDSGTATLGTSAARPLRKNRNTTTITSTMAIPIVLSTSRKRARMVVVRSLTGVMVMLWRDRACSCRDQRLDAVHNIDDVGAGLTVDDHQHCRLAIGDAEIAHILDAVVDIGDIAKAHRRIVAIGDDEGPGTGPPRSPCR